MRGNMSQSRFHARQAAVALLKMAKATSDPALAARLVEAAADLKDRVGEVPPPSHQAAGRTDRRLIPSATRSGPIMRTISTLLVEDEALIRMMLAQMVEDLGYLIVSEAANIEAAISLAETRSFDLALLDINLAGSLVTPLVHILDRRSVPIVFVSGYSNQTMPAELRGRLLVEKPFSQDALLNAINCAIGQAPAA